jgi:hypothetical protein
MGKQSDMTRYFERTGKRTAVAIVVVLIVAIALKLLGVF